ncbi:MAG TPA: uracil-DNA glycosylase [Clostridia bacterium]|nr:uracil-DNA glycosylase [Clostridia bacterium]
MKSDFTPALWPEDTAPEEAINCRKCELCRQRSRVIWGEGNPSAPIAVILDNPGAREDKEGNPFVCGARLKLQEAAHEAGLGAEDLYVTYILKCRPARRYDKGNARGTCMGYLAQQLERQKPKLVFCMGNTAVQWYFGDMEAEVKNLRGAWHDIKGSPTAVTYHPLAVRRRPNLMPQYLKDWQLLADRYFNEVRPNT